MTAFVDLLPAYCAIRSGDLTDLKRAVRNLRSLDVQDEDERTLLMEVAIEKAGSVEMMSVLLEAGADPNLQDGSGWTALHFAAQSVAPDRAALLITYGADIELADAHGNTPLFKAVFAATDDTRVVRLLLEAGADRHKANTHGVSSLSLAQTIANRDIAPVFDEVPDSGLES